MGLSDGEYRLILDLLGREPTYTELGMFAVMWSEHCGYKYSRPVLAYFKRYKEAIEGDGLENAGVVDLGDGWAVAMKVESHNHPSAVEPYQGAATGVGGIIRDILTMGARPIAALNSLRFGPIRDGEAEPEIVQRNRYLFEHVVAGIAGYGNCVGVPTVAGEVGFHRLYSGNPLVNAMCVGILRADQLATAAAAGEGNPVLYLGSATGKDGIHGATFASAELDEESEGKRPNVQIGDPFAEKLLIEATLEALQTGAIIAIQDMGAAGLTCSTVEMSSKGGVGMEIDLDLVPMRESDMTGYELMLSESQERMLAVAHRGREREIIDIFEKWGLPAAVIGRVAGGRSLRVTRFGHVEADLDPALLTDKCPTYTALAAEPEYRSKAISFDIASVPDTDPKESLLRLLGSPNVASKRWVYQQYDQQVQAQTVLVPGKGDAAVLAPRGTDKGLAIKIDGNARYVRLSPYVGGQLAVVEAARNVACTGATPRAVTDGLNFGNPQDPHVYWQFREAVRGIADAAEIMETPVISGNVSFYNESDLGEVPPTPLVGMLGVMQDPKQAIGLAPPRDAMLAILRVPLEVLPQEGLGASEYLWEVHGIEDGIPVPPNVEFERRLCHLLARAAREGIIVSAHDAGDGGIALAAAEIALAGGAVELEIPCVAGIRRRDAVLFAEAPGVVIVGVHAPGALGRLQALAVSDGLACDEAGSFSQGETGLSLRWDGGALSISGRDLEDRYENAIPRAITHEFSVDCVGFSSSGI